MFFFAPLAWRTTPLLMHLIFLPFLLFCLCLSPFLGGFAPLYLSSLKTLCGSDPSFLKLFQNCSYNVGSVGIYNKCKE